MKLLAISVSMGEEVPYRGETVKTGIFKKPVSGPIMLRSSNLDGDRQVDREAHGGPYRAACVYTIENYGHWERELGRSDLQFPQFGENFTVEGMHEDDIFVGDVFRIGGALVEVTQPRVPCYRLGIKMKNPRFPKMFLQSRLVGFYLKVLEEGIVEAGDAITLTSKDAVQMSIREICNLYYFDRANVEDCRRAVRIEALSPGWRQGFQERLENVALHRGEPERTRGRAAGLDLVHNSPGSSQ